MASLCSASLWVSFAVTGAVVPEGVGAGWHPRPTIKPSKNKGTPYKTERRKKRPIVKSKSGSGVGGGGADDANVGAVVSTLFLSPGNGLACIESNRINQPLQPLSHTRDNMVESTQLNPNPIQNCAQPCSYISHPPGPCLGQPDGFGLRSGQICRKVLE